jgi:hypothetical protein
VDIAEDYADDLASEEKMAAACRDAWEIWSEWPRIDQFTFKAVSAAAWATKPVIGLDEASIVMQCSLQAECLLGPQEAKGDRAELIREVFGNPFRAGASVLSWSSSGRETILSLADSIYDDPCFEDLPILADALMDAGCNDEHILNHCRSPGAHVRGCWVVDLLLGKE